MKSACISSLFLRLIVAFQAVSTVAGLSKPKSPTYQQSQSLNQPSYRTAGKHVNISQAVNQGESLKFLQYFVKVTTKSTVCGGSLLSPRYVITTATCGRSAEGEKFSLHYLYYTDDTPDWYFTYVGTSSDWIEHPKFRLDTNSDKYNLALVRMAKDPLELQLAEISSVEILLFDDLIPPVGDLVSIFGVGDSDGAEGACMNVDLQYAMLKIKPMSYCTDFPQLANMTDENFVCIASDNSSKGACTFDEGGPLGMAYSFYPELIGIIGRQPNPCPPCDGFPTKVIKLTAEIVGWIQQYTKKDFGSKWFPPSCSLKRNTAGVRGDNWIHPIQSPVSKSEGRK